MKKRIVLEIIAFILFLAILTFAVFRLSYLYMPERRDYGATWNMYCREQKDSIDVMFFGSSLAFCDIIPARIYENSGITSYVMAAPESTVPIMYYYVKEALKTQKPEVIFAEISGMYFDEYTNYTDVSVGYMPYSENRLAATFFAAEPEARTGLLFPLYKYHNRWQETRPSKYFFGRDDEIKDPWAGYTLLATAAPQENVQLREVNMENVNFEKNSEYIKKLEELCEKEGIKLEFFIVPSCWNYSDENVEKLRGLSEYAEFYDFNDSFEEMGFDLQNDFYDLLHLNIFGAVKFSDYLSEYISQKYNFDLERVHDEDIWNTRISKLEEALNEYSVKVSE